MLPESSSVKAVNLVKKSATVTEIMKFSKGIVFYWRTLYITSRAKKVKCAISAGVQPILMKFGMTMHISFPNLIN